jgi:altronate hydrolase
MVEMARLSIRLTGQDNVTVALSDVASGTALDGVIALGDVSAGHKIALRAIAPGEPVIKFGYPIGVASAPIAPGEHVHSHNLKSTLKDDLNHEKTSRTAPAPLPKPERSATFDGYRRTDGRAGIRNEIWIINTVGCVNNAAERIATAATAELVYPGSGIEGVHAFKHQFGCSQLGHDLESTQKILAGLVRHPNAAAVLILGLGCENNQIRSFLEKVGPADPERVQYFNAQDVDDEVEEGLTRVRKLAEFARKFRREPLPASELVIGMKCGGSDGLSGITANPLVGRIADLIAGYGGSVLLTEVPEMFGAEQVLLERSCTTEVASETVEMVNAFRAYFRKYNEPIDENPAPGNIAGGITTLAEKSLGCVQKAGHAPIAKVLAYGEAAPQHLGGVALINAPGNDAVSSTALVAAGANIVLFTTGRGTPMGFPAPTVKISTNSALAEKKRSWIDFDAGPIASGSSDFEPLADELFSLLLDVASGRRMTQSERNGFREISIWKDGVTL